MLLFSLIPYRWPIGPPQAPATATQHVSASLRSVTDTSTTVLFHNHPTRIYYYFLRCYPDPNYTGAPSTSWYSRSIRLANSSSLPCRLARLMR